MAVYDDPTPEPTPPPPARESLWRRPVTWIIGLMLLIVLCGCLALMAVFFVPTEDLDDARVVPTEQVTTIDYVSSSYRM